MSPKVSNERQKLMMEPVAKVEGTPEEQRTVRTQAVPVALTALSVRLFAYGGQQGKLRDLTWQLESALTALLRTLVHDGQGNVTQIGDNVLLAHFGNPLHALALAAEAVDVSSGRRDRADRCCCPDTWLE